MVRKMKRGGGTRGRARRGEGVSRTKAGGVGGGEGRREEEGEEEEGREEEGREEEGREEEGGIRSSIWSWWKMNPIASQRDPRIPRVGGG